MEELKPCPFCGGKADIFIYDDGPAYVHCKSCGASTQVFDNGGHIKAWDTRADGWQPIETAPESELVLMSNGEYVLAGYKEHSDYGGYCYPTSDLNYADAPTHWQPLPQPPEA